MTFLVALPTVVVSIVSLREISRLGQAWARLSKGAQLLANPGAGWRGSPTSQTHGKCVTGANLGQRPPTR